jgi:DNA-binding XRE family transcriptional regulator
MKLYDIIDGSRRDAKPCAQLSYDADTDAVEILIAPDAGENDVPMLLDAFVARGQRKVKGGWAKRWVAERTIPASRQNLGEILKAHGLEFYDAFKLFEDAEGRCSQDDFYIRSVLNKQGRSPQLHANLAQEVGNQLHAARLKAGLTQMELARRAGVGQAVVSRLESGQGNPTVALVADIARALSVEPSFALSQAPKPDSAAGASTRGTRI